jgi:hypothetical protein
MPVENPFSPLDEGINSSIFSDTWRSWWQRIVIKMRVWKDQNMPVPTTIHTNDEIL